MNNTIDFTKNSSKEYIDIGDTFTLSYSFTNNDPSINISKITIQDDILKSIPNLTVNLGKNAKNLNSSTGEFEVELNNNLLLGDSITSEIELTINSGIDYTINFNTTSTPKFKDAMNIEIPSDINSTTPLFLETSNILISKTPNIDTVVVCGTEISYIITITCEGNVDSKINVNDFEDFFPSYTKYKPGSLFVTSPFESTFILDETESKIYNSSDVVIPINQIIEIRFSLWVLD